MHSSSRDDLRQLLYGACWVGFLAGAAWGFWGLAEAEIHPFGETAPLNSLFAAVVDWPIAIALFALAFVQRQPRLWIQLGMAAFVGALPILTAHELSRRHDPLYPREQRLADQKAMNTAPKVRRPSIQPLRFRTDVDLISPAGSVPGNAAEWFGLFSQGGTRSMDWAVAGTRLTTIGDFTRVLPADDPLLAEAEPWIERQTCEFFPNPVDVAHMRQRSPNLEMMTAIGRSFISRGVVNHNVDDLRRAIRLGRLMRKDDFLVEQDRAAVDLVQTAASALVTMWSGNADKRRRDVANQLAHECRDIAEETDTRVRWLTPEAAVAYDMSFIIVTAERAEDRRFRVTAVDALIRLRDAPGGNPRAAETLQQLRQDRDGLFAAYVESRAFSLSASIARGVR